MWQHFAKRVGWSSRQKILNAKVLSVVRAEHRLGGYRLAHDGQLARGLITLNCGQQENCSSDGWIRFHKSGLNCVKYLAKSLKIQI